LIAAFIGGAAILSIVMLAIFFQGKSTDATKSSIHADQTAVAAPLQGTNKLNPPPSDILAAQTRLIELGFLKGPADGVWGGKSRTALRAFKVANGLAADEVRLIAEGLSRIWGQQAVVVNQPGAGGAIAAR
jgi:peptidoglycan hydrolase-like protein with peptidoglycan-binding domain